MKDFGNFWSFWNFWTTPWLKLIWVLSIVSGLDDGLYTNHSQHVRKFNNIDNRNEIRGIFPPGFLWGLSSTAYQTEGAWNAEGKGESSWDRFVHSGTNSSPVIVDNSNGDVAADSYFQWRQDVKLLSDARVDMYRFSISWSRVMPQGSEEKINVAGIKHYNALINALLEKRIQPMVTLFAWDLPQNIQDSVGGWEDEETVRFFADYARVCFRNFGDRVKHWITFNDPFTFCFEGYETGKLPPRVKNPGVAVYRCVHSILKAHSLAVAIYREEFQKTQQGKISIALLNTWQEPADPDSSEDIKAAQQSFQFTFGWFAHPIANGTYPPLMRRIIDEKCKQAGRNESRLPEWVDESKELIKGSFDFVAINHYTTQLVKFRSDHPKQPSWEDDSGTTRFYDDSWPSTASSWLKVAPWGLRKALVWIKENFNDPEIFITDNGASESAESDQKYDVSPAQYFESYLSEMSKAIHIDGCRVKGYIARSFLDSFEWDRGYTEKFGLYSVDFESKKKLRRPKPALQSLQKCFF